jgi:hypothetical protein
MPASLRTSAATEQFRLQSSTAPRPSFRAAAFPTFTSSWCAPAADGPKGISTVLVEDGTPGLSFGAQGKEDGLESPTDFAWSSSTIATSRAENLVGEEGKGFTLRHEAASTAAVSTSRPAALGAARSPRSTRRLRYMHEREGLRSRLARPISRRCSSSSLTWKPNCRPPAPSCARRPEQTRPEGRTRRHQVLRHGKALRHRHRRSTSPTRRCRSTAATATSPITVSRRSSAISRVHQILEGANEIMRLIVSRALLAERAA